MDKRSLKKKENPSQKLLRVRKYQARHPERVKECQRRVKLKSKFGLSREEYTRLLGKQENACAICRKTQQENGKAKRELAVDHNHSTGEVRGILCLTCNILVGTCFERVDILEKAIKYLERTNCSI